MDVFSSIYEECHTSSFSEGIREASASDIPVLIGMAEKFIGAAWSHIGVPFDSDTCKALLLNMIAAVDAAVLVTTDLKAMMGAVVYPWHFNVNVLTGQELFWWSESQDGMALVRAAEAWARDRGAVTFNMACMEHMRGRVIGRLYRRQGYEPNEHIYIKALN